MTTGKAPDDTPLIACRATVNLADAHTRIRPGKTVWVDPNEPYIAERIAAGWLVPIEGHAHSG